MAIASARSFEITFEEDVLSVQLPLVIKPYECFLITFRELFLGRKTLEYDT